MDSVQEYKAVNDGMDTNKLRLYKTFKASFNCEPYIDLVKNRNQRSDLTRIRISAHHLEIERGRWSGTPANQRFCKYCKFSGSTEKLVDDEKHFALICPSFAVKRQCFLGKLRSIGIIFDELDNDQKLKIILCPVSTRMAKIVNKYFSILVNARKKLDEGATLGDLGFRPPSFDEEEDSDFELESVGSISSEEA